MLRSLTCILLLGVLVGCQTSGTDTEGVLGSAVPVDEAQVSAIDPDASSQEGEDAETAESDIGQDAVDTSSNAEESTPAQNGDLIINGLREIAAIRTKGGERAAVEAVFACYKSARDRSVSLGQARVCAAQDFAISREIIAARPDNATGTGDRALFVSKRHAERIGALMKLKGMNQSQFNTFGRYLHAVAEPEYKKARQS